MASDFETVIAKCDGCKHEEECREMPPCILDAYNKGRADAIDEFADKLKQEFSIRFDGAVFELFCRLVTKNAKQLKEHNK